MSTEDDLVPVSPIMVHQSHLDTIRKDLVTDSLSADDVCKLFDQFLGEFEKMEKSGITTTKMFLDAVEEITDAVLLISPYKLLDAKVITHPLMRFLHQMLDDLLANWKATDSRLNIQETDIFLKVTCVFVRAFDQASEPDAEAVRKRMTDLLTTKSIVYLIGEQINDSQRNKNGINDDPNICTLGLLTVKLFKNCQFYFSNDRNIYLIDCCKYPNTSFWKIYDQYIREYCII